ncbi:hypothetical protein [Streptomyces sp. NPDC001068]|uniref:hypothetical protein n=1 Tax=Streptomyces sp. NPDC001068 TaxID=3364544 RepID=UPI0036B03CEC
MSASPAVRSLRAAVFAAVCVLLAAAGHALAMGRMPPLWADAAGLVAVFGPVRALAGRERGLPEIAVGMLLTQTGLHFGFAATTPTPPGTMSMAGMSTAGMSTAAMSAPHMSAAHMSMGHMRMHGDAMVAMAQRYPQAHALTAHATLAHVLAALVASWWLRRGEAALWSLLRRAVALVPGLAAWWRDAPLPSPATGPRRAPAGPARPRRLRALRHAVSRRGPPAVIPYPV